jgi:predicted MPP superfamily phosphohydrolase
MSLVAPILISILVFSFVFNSILGLRLVFADSTNTNISYYIGASKEALAAGNIPAAIANLTQAVKLVSIEQKSFYDIVAVGDWGCTAFTNKTIDNILDRDPNLVIALGDYSYLPTPDCWAKEIAPLHDRMRIAIGNHDIPAVAYLKLFGIDESKQYYSFNRGNIHFVVMSTEIPFDAGSAQYKEVKSDLQKASADPKIKWIIVVNHRMTYPRHFAIGDTAGITYQENTISRKFRDIYHPLFDIYNVDLVLQGHAHNYQRTYPLEYNTINPDIPVITNSHKNSYLNPEGVLFVTVGTGGVNEHGFPFSENNVAYNAESRGVSPEEDTYGILYLKVQKDGSLLEGFFYNNNVGPHPPYVQDTFSIKKIISKFENTIPIMKFKNVTTDINTPITINLTGIDQNSDAILRYKIVSGPTHGSLGSLNANNGAVLYAPITGFRGEDSFAFNAMDSNNRESNIANVTITVMQ